MTVKNDLTFNPLTTLRAAPRSYNIHCGDAINELRREKERDQIEKSPEQLMYHRYNNNVV